jgi:hypothetical protein
VLGSAEKTVKDMSNAKWGEVLEDAFEVAGSLLGLPVAQVKRCRTAFDEDSPKGFVGAAAFGNYAK